MEKVIPLAASIILSTGLFAVFKFVGKKGIDQFPVIIVNYITCFVLGNLILGDRHILKLETINTPGFWPLLSLGMLFVGTFFLMAKSTHESGAAASSMASKMSMIIPILASVVFWGEAVNIQMIVGIFLAISSVYIISTMGSNLNSDPHSLPPKKFNIVLILVFFGSGMVDTLLNVFKQLNYNEFNNEQKAALTFGGAMISGLLVGLLKRARKSNSDAPKNQLVLTLISGIVLGSINFYSVVALYAAIDAFSDNTAVMFSLNNVGVVVLSTAVGWFFGERPATRVFWGMGLAILSILVLAF